MRDTLGEGITEMGERLLLDDFFKYFKLYEFYNSLMSWELRMFVKQANT